MNKIVNSKNIEIDNFELFEQAAESVVINRTITNTTSINDCLSKEYEISHDAIHKIIHIYDEFHKRIPYPLNSLDTDLRYAAAFWMLKIKMKLESDVDIKAYIDDGLHIILDSKTNTVLTFINRTWGIEDVANIPEQTIETDKYVEHPGFKEFIWVVERMVKNEKINDYYSIFMRDFFEACNKNPMVLKWELANILTFSNPPKHINFQENRIYDVVTGDTYSLDIYTVGSRGVGKKQQVWTLDPTQDTPIESRNKQVPVYNYTTFIKPTNTMNKPKHDMLRPVDIQGISSLFCKLCTLKATHDTSVFPKFYGLFYNDYFVFIIDSKLYVCDKTKYSDVKEIARGVELYGADNGFVYFAKYKRLTAGVSKETIYSYSLSDTKLRVCKIQMKQL